ncbi:MAG: hypothetical protein JWM36_3703 [Hyphomicrobiales bacterium]|nr:hypothetical protein [Hyphomicrobiales bacterium]
MTIWNIRDEGERQPRVRRTGQDGLARSRPARTIDYDRAKMLPRLLPMGLEDLRGAEPQTTEAIVSKLARALRSERTRGRAGHWTYDPERHLRLCAAFHAESRALKTRPVR